MGKQIHILLAIFLFSIRQVNAQSVDIEKYNQEKELILNVVINSVQFDSIYTAKKVYFVASELLSEETPLVLKKGNCEAKVISEKAAEKKGLDYVHLGDFTMAETNPTRVRIQIYSSENKETLNLSLVKRKQEWVIDNHLIIKD